MLNYNGNLVAFDDVKITPNNRAFKYGDSVFETIKVVHGKLVFWEEHYFRLMASMRMLRMKTSCLQNRDSSNETRLRPLLLLLKQ